MTSFILRALIAALGLWIATEAVPGIQVGSATTLVLAGVLLGIVNAIVKPVAVILTLPLTFVTLGLFLLVVNAAMLGLVALLLPGFAISGFWAALTGALIVSVVSWIGNAMFRPGRAFRDKD